MAERQNKSCQADRRKCARIRASAVDVEGRNRIEETDSGVMVIGRQYQPYLTFLRDVSAGDRLCERASGDPR